MLEKCLRALVSPGVKGNLRLEIIVVDNASRDGSAQAARKFADVRVVETGRNLGDGRANNRGLGQATGRALLILNPDTEPQPGSLEALLAFMQENSKAGIVSPRLLNTDRSVQNAAFRFPTLLMAALDLFPLPEVIPGRLRARVLNSASNGRYPQEATARTPFRIDHPLGACMLLRREAYETAGGFDPAIHMYSEEIDLAFRYMKLGWECWQEPRARIVHHGGSSTSQVPDRMFVELWHSRLFIYSRYHSLPESLTLRTLLCVAQVRDAAAILTGLAKGKVDRTAAARGLVRAAATLWLALTP